MIYIAEICIILVTFSFSNGSIIAKFEIVFIVIIRTETQPEPSTTTAGSTNVTTPTVTEKPPTQIIDTNLGFTVADILEIIKDDSFEPVLSGRLVIVNILNFKKHIYNIISRVHV